MNGRNRAATQRILEAAAEHMCDHAVALAAALPSLLSDAEAAVPPPAPRRPAVPVASPFAVTRTPAGLQSPPAVPASKGAGSDDMPSSARRSSIASHVGHAQLLPSFDSEAGSAALGGGVHGVGSVELPTQDSQQLSGFDRIDSVRMPSFGDHFRTDRLDSMRMPSFRDNFRTVRAASLNCTDRSLPSVLVFNSPSRPSGDLDAAPWLLPSFMPRRPPAAPLDSDSSAAGAPPGLRVPPPPPSPALAPAGSSSTARHQLRRLGAGGALAARDSSHSLQHYLEGDGVHEGQHPPQHQQQLSPQPEVVAFSPEMACLFISAPNGAAVLRPGLAAPAELRAEIDAAFPTAATPRRSQLEGLEVPSLLPMLECMLSRSPGPGLLYPSRRGLGVARASYHNQHTVLPTRLTLVQVMGLEAEGRSHSLGSAGSQSLSGFSVAAARTLSHGSSNLEHALDSIPTCRGRSSTESVPEVEAVSS